METEFFMGFTGCGKTPFAEGYGLQPVNKSRKINAGFSHRGDVLGHFARDSAFFRSLFSRAAKAAKSAGFSPGGNAPPSSPSGKMLQAVSTYKSNGCA
jgi:hypothetical protein